MIMDKFYYRPLEPYLRLGESEIEGHGIFAAEPIKSMTNLGPTHIKMPLYQGYVRTPLGGFLNHSEDANCELNDIYDWDDYRVYHLFAKRDIEEGEELTLNYDV